ncbi:MAG: hypothetical protein WC718_16320 [Phycisphaerales bacterium]|jgi:hypothetical protein
MSEILLQAFLRAAELGHKLSFSVELIDRGTVRVSIRTTDAWDKSAIEHVLAVHAVRLNENRTRAFDYVLRKMFAKLAERQVP